MPADYSHLKPVTVWQPLEIPEMPDAAVLVEPIGLDNAGWLNFVMAANAKERADAAGVSEADAAQATADIVAARREVAAMLARTCVRDWRGIVDAHGHPVTYSPEEAEHFLGYIAEARGSLIDKLVAACKRPEPVAAMEAVANPS